MEPTDQNKTRAANIRTLWDAMQAPQWYQKILINLGKDMYAKRSLKDLSAEEFNLLLPRLVEIVEVLEARFKPTAPSPEQAFLEALQAPNWDWRLLAKLSRELEDDKLGQLTSRLVVAAELLGVETKPAAPAPPGPEGALSATGAAGPGPCPAGATGPVGPTGCTSGPSGPAAPASQPATQKNKKIHGETREITSVILAPGSFHPTSPNSPGATLPPAFLGIPTTPPTQQPGDQRTAPASESLPPGPEPGKE